MKSTLNIACFVEGDTDRRFLSPVIKRTFEDLSNNIDYPIQIAAPIFLAKSTKKDIQEYQNVVPEYDIILIHLDSDKPNDDTQARNTYNNIISIFGQHQTKFIPIIPITMIEAWVLADESAFLNQLQTDLSYSRLGINKNLEKIANPKKSIEEAIRVVDQQLPKKRRGKIKIGELYEILGENIRLSELQKLSSYQQFLDAARQALIKANFLQP